MCDYKGNEIKRKIEQVEVFGQMMDQVWFVCPECDEPICIWCGSHEIPGEVLDSDDGGCHGLS